mmetsp:Transcript_11152/g.68694  ORF Transcript_11152/g.68694 Transcript_11152/m.68694 type:complete len:285 (+) Transcript_11152:2096-2950(+)
MAQPSKRVLLVRMGSADASHLLERDAVIEAKKMGAAGGANVGVHSVVAGELLEWNVWRPSFGTWMAGNAVLDDSSLYMATPVDPLFAMISLLEKSRQKSMESDGRFCDVEHIVGQESGSDILLGVNDLEQRLQSICNVKETGGMKFFRLCDEKLLAWLCCKVDQVMGALQEHCGGMFTQLATEALQTYSVEFLSDYLSHEWAERLRKVLHLPALGMGAKEAFGDVRDADEGNFISRESAEDRKKRQAQVKVRQQEETKKKAKLAKAAAAARGTKQLTTFFSKKT